MKHMPQIMKHMTPMPHSINKDLTINKGLEMMREHQIRHLPVQSEGRIIGLVTDRDIKFAASFEGAAELTIEEVMTPDPYIVQPEAPLNTVVENMAEHKYGCAIIQQPNGKLVGIFTTVDAMRVFGQMLQSNYTA